MANTEVSELKIGKETYEICDAKARHSICDYFKILTFGDLEMDLGSTSNERIIKRIPFSLTQFTAENNWTTDWKLASVLSIAYSTRDSNDYDYMARTWGITTIPLKASTADNAQTIAQIPAMEVVWRKWTNTHRVAVLSARTLWIKTIKNLNDKFADTESSLWQGAQNIADAEDENGNKIFSGGTSIWHDQIVDGDGYLSLLS